MRTMLSVLLACSPWCFSSAAFALGSEAPKAELSGGYSQAFGVFNPNTKGWYVAGAGNLNAHMGLVADLSGMYSHSNCFAPSREHLQTLMVSPRLSFRHGRLSPYAHLLLGAGWQSVTASMPEWKRTTTGFAISPGVGLNIRIGGALTLRAGQLDGILVGSHVGGFIRLSFGLGINLGTRKPN